MTLLVIGPPPDDFSELPWPKSFTFLPREDQAPFELDAVMAFLPVKPGDQERKLLLAARSGRPVVLIGEGRLAGELTGRVKLLERLTSGAVVELVQWLSVTSRTNYLPIDCNFYDEFEAAIVTKKLVRLEYLDSYGRKRVLSTQLKDTKTDRTEEYLQLMDGSWIRFDRVYAVNGVLAGDSCRF